MFNREQRTKAYSKRIELESNMTCATVFTIGQSHDDKGGLINSYTFW